jgi:hypothetical protein
VHVVPVEGEAQVAQGMSWRTPGLYAVTAAGGTLRMTEVQLFSSSDRATEGANRCGRKGMHPRVSRIRTAGPAGSERWETQA